MANIRLGEGIDWSGAGVKDLAPGEAGSRPRTRRVVRDAAGEISAVIEEGRSIRRPIRDENGDIVAVVEEFG